jgi:hypothetical protein
VAETSSERPDFGISRFILSAIESDADCLSYVPLVLTAGDLQLQQSCQFVHLRCTFDFSLASQSIDKITVQKPIAECLKKKMCRNIWYRMDNWCHT